MQTDSGENQQNNSGAKTLFAGGQVMPTSSGGAPLAEPAGRVSASTSTPTSAPPMPSPPQAMQPSFQPAETIPELMTLENTAGAKFNQGEVPAANLAPAENKLKVTFNPQEKQAAPKAGIVQGSIPGTPVVATETVLEGQQQAAGPAGVKQPKKKFGVKQWIYVALAAIFLLVFIILGVNLLSPAEEVDVTPPTPTAVNRPSIIIEYWGLWRAEGVIKQVLQQFQNETGISVNYVQQKPAGYRVKLQNALETGNGPDVFRYHVTWVPMFKERLATLPATIYSQANYQQYFYPLNQKMLTVNNQVVGIPLMHDDLVLFYNPDLLAAAGVAVPQNWANFQQAAVDLTQRDALGNIVQYGAAMGLAENVDHFSDIIGLLALQSEVDLTFADATDLMNEQNMMTVLSFYTNFVNDGERKTWDSVAENSLDEFAAGNLGMMLAPSYRLHDVLAINPQASVALAKAPVTNATATEPTWGTYWVEGVNSMSTKQESAWQFLQYMSSPEIQQQLYNEQKRLGAPMGEVYSRTDIAQSLSQDLLAQPVLSQAAQSETFYLCGNTWDEGINDQLIKYYQDAINGMTLGQGGGGVRTSAEEAMNLIRRGTQEVLTKYGVLVIIDGVTSRASWMK